MKVLLAKWWETLWSSYWFLPAMMSAGAVIFSQGFLWFDARMDGTSYAPDMLLMAYQPEGARAMLSTIAGSMITVAGVVFSVTISALSFASNQFGPRLLTNFMRDRGNQITLGTFTATFVYCLLVLRTVRSAGESVQPGGETLPAFVPHLALLGALGFALASVTVLIYFVHHVPVMIHASKLVAKLGAELAVEVGRACPSRDQKGSGRVSPNPERLALRRTVAASVRSQESGYVQHVDFGELVALADKSDLFVYVECRPGDFALLNQPLIKLWPAESVSSETVSAMQRCFVLGEQRTQSQDLMFLVKELVEIAARALSPGVNDPYTAMECLNWLGNTLAMMLTRESSFEVRTGEDGKTPRLMVEPVSFAAMAQWIVEQLSPYVGRDRNAAVHLIKVMGSLASGSASDGDRALMAGIARRFGSVCMQLMASSEAREDVTNALDLAFPAENALP